MTINTLGDLARNFQMRAQQVRMKTEIDRLSQEVTTGLAADVATRVRGDFAPISGVERDLARLAAYRSATTEAAGFAGAAQQALGRIEGLVADLGPGLLAAASTNPAGLALIVGEDAEAAFGTAVSSLNTAFAGRYLFSGAATTSPPLDSADSLLAALRVDVAAETTAAGVVAAVDAWFGPGGAFEATHYLGSDTPLAPMRVSEGENVSMTATAADPSLREALVGLALGALLRDGPLAANSEQQEELSRLAGERLLSAQPGLAEQRAELGSVEAAIERASVRNAARAAGLELARAEILGVDPYESATRLEAVQTQLETLYSVTARTSRLSLADFLR